MRWCYKELRNGPCGGSTDPYGSCEARPEQECIWNVIYRGTLAMGNDPRKFARTLIPPRDWGLDGTNALANRFAGIDNRDKCPGNRRREAEGGRQQADKLRRQGTRLHFLPTAYCLLPTLEIQTETEIYAHHR